MTIKEESSFLQGVERRLDSLFAEDTKPIKEKEIDTPQTTVEEVVADVKHKNIREIHASKKQTAKLKFLRANSRCKIDHPLSPKSKNVFRRYSAMTTKTRNLTYL